jgi:hypothetical protein
MDYIITDAGELAIRAALKDGASLDADTIADWALRAIDSLESTGECYIKVPSKYSATGKSETVRLSADAWYVEA